MTPTQYQAEVAAMWQAQLEDIPIEAIVAYLRARGFVVDALPSPPLADADLPFDGEDTRA